MDSHKSSSARAVDEELDRIARESTDGGEAAATPAHLQEDDSEDIGGRVGHGNDVGAQRIRRQLRQNAERRQHLQRTTAINKSLHVSSE